LFSLPPLPHFIFVTLHELDASPNFSLQYIQLLGAWCRLG
jgi:hypothetical protein